MLPTDKQSTQSTHYSVTVTLELPSGSVVDTSCECVASTMSRCSHISGVLFALEDYTIEFGFEPIACTSCTSQHCSWNRGSKRKTPGIVHEQNYGKKWAPDRIISHDPRAAADKVIPEKQMHNNFVRTLSASASMWSTILDVEFGD